MQERFLYYRNRFLYYRRRLLRCKSDFFSTRGNFFTMGMISPQQDLFAPMGVIFGERCVCYLLYCMSDFIITERFPYHKTLFLYYSKDFFTAGIISWLQELILLQEPISFLLEPFLYYKTDFLTRGAISLLHDRLL